MAALVHVEPAPPDLVDAELLGRPHLEARAERLDAHRLHRADHDDPAAVQLRIEERVRDPERHLVAELGRPHRVADDEDVHGRRSYPASVESPPVDADLRTLRERLAEISDIQRSVGVLFWDQRVTMPPLRLIPLARTRVATLGRIAHERFVDDEIGSLLERLRPLEESLEYDSDDASLIRVTRRDWEKERRVPVGPPHGDAPCRGARVTSSGSRRARTTTSRASSRSLERNLELKKRYVECFEWDDSPYTALLDDFEPFMKTHRGRGGVRHHQAGAVRARPRGARGSTRRFSSDTYPEELQREFGERVLATVGFDRRRVPARPDRPSVLHLVLDARRAADDALRRDRPRLALVDDARGGPRPVRARHRLLARADAARERALARAERVAEPHLGEPRRAAAGRSGRTGTSRSRRPSPTSSGASSSTSSSPRSTAPSRV